MAISWFAELTHAKLWRHFTRGLAMHPRVQRRAKLDEHILFFRQFLQRPKEVAYIVPSSRYLMRRLVRYADVPQARVIVELGPGTGGTSHTVLRAMHPDAKLLAIEINPRFARHLRRTIHDSRFHVYEGCAENIAEALEKNGLDQPDLIYSGIPFSTIPDPVGRSILQTSNEALAPGGRFVAYQLRDRVKILGDRIFDHPSSTAIELLNVPPMRFYRWDKDLWADETAQFALTEHAG